MGRSVLVIAGLAVLSTSAFASKARMEALGQGSTSYYLSDSRSVFLNPASLNDNKNYVVTEWGTASQASTNALSSDSTTTPRAEGGFFREMGAFAYGLYLGNNGDLRTTLPANTTSALSDKAFANHQNGLDLVFAGDMGLKWGARVHFANPNYLTGVNATTPFVKKNTAFGLGLGVNHGDLDGYVNLNLSDKSTGATVASDEWNKKPGFQVGVGYKFAGLNLFADVTTSSQEVKKGTSSTLTSATLAGVAVDMTSSSSLTHKSTDMIFGVSKLHEVNPSARIVADMRFRSLTDEFSGSSTTTLNGKKTAITLPVTFALEADATSWLVLRGSISQNVILGQTKSVSGLKSTLANSTSVNAGASLNFGKLKVDGVIGNTPGARSGGTLGAKEGVLSTDNLMSRVGVTYNF
jgi:hypothetical protein